MNLFHLAIPVSDLDTLMTSISMYLAVLKADHQQNGWILTFMDIN